MDTAPVGPLSSKWRWLRGVSYIMSLRWRHNGHDGVSYHLPHDCFLNRLFRRRSNKTSKLCVTGLCAGNSPGTGEFPHKGPVTRKMFSFDDVIMWKKQLGVSRWDYEPCNWCVIHKRKFKSQFLFHILSTFIKSGCSPAFINSTYWYTLRVCHTFWKSTMLTHWNQWQIHEWTGSTLIQVIACRICGAKSIPDPMLIVSFPSTVPFGAIFI